MTSPPPCIVLFWICLCNNDILHFISFSFSHLAHVEVFLCLVAAPVRISSHTEGLSSSCSVHYTHTPFQSLASTLWAGNTLMTTYHHPHSSIYKLCGHLAFLLDYWPLKVGPVGIPEMLVRNYYYLLHNNPQECSAVFNNVLFFMLKVLDISHWCAPGEPYRIMWIGIEVSKYGISESTRLKCFLSLF